MRLLSLSSLAGLKRLSVAGGILLLAMQVPATAETITTVNGLPIDSQVFDFYVQSRTQRTAEQLSPAERETLLQGRARTNGLGESQTQRILSRVFQSLRRRRRCPAKSNRRVLRRSIWPAAARGLSRRLRSVRRSDKAVRKRAAGLLPPLPARDPESL